MSDLPVPLIETLQREIGWILEHRRKLVALVDDGRSKPLTGRFERVLDALGQIAAEAGREGDLVGPLRAQIGWLIEHEAELTRAVENEHPATLSERFQDALLALRRVRTELDRREDVSSTPDITVVREGRNAPTLKVMLGETCIGWVSKGLVEAKTRRSQDATTVYNVYRPTRVMFKRPFYDTLTDAIGRLLEEIDPADHQARRPQTEEPPLKDRLRAAGLTRVEIASALGAWVRITKVATGRNPNVREAAAAFGLPGDLVRDILEQPCHRLNTTDWDPENPTIYARP